MNDHERLMALLSDQPAERDQLGFDPYAKTLAEIVADPHTDTPLTIGVFGGWGQGKTSLMSMVERRLKEPPQDRSLVRTVWFNAWLYSRQEALWRALIARVLEAVRKFDLGDAVLAELQQLEGRLYGVTEPSDGRLTLPPGVIPGLEEASLPTRMGLELMRLQAQRRHEKDPAGKETEESEETKTLREIIDDVDTGYALTRRDRIVALDDFRRHFEELSRKCIAGAGHRLVVFVDDLDRCLPEKAVEVLEAIKLFLDVPGFVFLLGVDREVVEEGIRVRYAAYETQQLSGARYLEKIIQIPFSLPPIEVETVTDYVNKVTAGKLPDERCERVFSVGLDPNPRRIKRTLNVFLLLWRLSRNREALREVIQPVRLAKVVVIQQHYSQLFDLLVEGPHYLRDLEERFRARGADAERQGLRGEEAVEGNVVSGEVEEISAGRLQPFLGKSLLRELLTCTAEDELDANFAGSHGLTPVEVKAYIYLTRSTVEEEVVTEEATIQRLPFEPQMVRVPAGPFLMGTPESEVEELTRLAGLEEKHIRREVPQHEVTLDYDYAIARYPITNAEFRRFIEDGGYEEREYWTAAGWKAKERESWTRPRFCDDDTWNDPSQPVVGVSWYEALAYCRWLSAQSGKQYRLPTEAEWEKAARGTDGRRYPWGNTWDPALCNNKESGPGRTTPVGEYPQGKSPYGVEELVGQLWEWCRTRYRYGGTDAKPEFTYPYVSDDGREDEEGDDRRIRRGGSWWDADPAGVCRCGVRDWPNPLNRSDYTGFRCVRILSSAP